MTSTRMQVAKMILAMLALATLSVGCSNETATANRPEPAGPTSSENYRGKPATEHTARANAALEQFLPIGDFLDGSMMIDFNESTLVAPLPAVVGTNDLRQFEFLKGERPDPMNPSLFHSSSLALEDTGLYRVAEGFYQIRGDIAHITAMRGETGWPILDPGTTKEFTEQAWAFAVQHLPGGADVPIVAVFYSHSHIDHWGGVRGLVSREEVDAGRVKVTAPYGFMDETVAENIIAGNAMSRRSQYQFGITLEVQDDGTGFATLGGALQMSQGETTLIAPTLTLPEGPGEITMLEVDGVEILFKDISGAEAPSAALVYVPKYRLIFNSELFFRGLHNVYTLRGALVRDALQWSKYINEVLLEWSDPEHHDEHCVVGYGEGFFVELANANLNSARIASSRAADTTVTIAENDLKLVLLGQTTVADLEEVGRASVEGDQGTLQAIASRLDTFSPDFPLVPMPTRSLD